MTSLLNFNIVRLVVGIDDAVADEEIYGDECAVCLEAALSQILFDLINGPQLEMVNFVVIWLWYD